VIPALIGPYLLGQRVEVKTKLTEVIGVVTWADRARGLLVLSEPDAYAGWGWTHRGRRWAQPVEEIERLTVLEGPPPIPLEDRGFLEPPKQVKRRPRYDIVRCGKIRSI